MDPITTLFRVETETVFNPLKHFQNKIALIQEKMPELKYVQIQIEGPGDYDGRLLGRMTPITYAISTNLCKETLTTSQKSYLFDLIQPNPSSLLIKHINFPQTENNKDHYLFLFGFTPEIITKKVVHDCNQKSVSVLAPIFEEISALEEIQHLSKANEICQKFPELNTPPNKSREICRLTNTPEYSISEPRTFHIDLATPIQI